VSVTAEQPDAEPPDAEPPDAEPPGRFYVDDGNLHVLA
jgi:hypothetical protein